MRRDAGISSSFGVGGRAARGLGKWLATGTAGGGGYRLGTNYACACTARMGDSGFFVATITGTALYAEVF